MSTEAMIDIETFDTADTAVVFQIGLVLFGDKPTRHSIWNLDVQSQIDAGRTISADTLKFWLDPDISSVAQTSLRSPEPYRSALASLDEMLTGHVDEVGSIWAKGSFDFNVLESLYKQCGRLVPWEFYQCRDLRTLMKECDVPKHGNISHNALDDCQHQVLQLLECRRVIGGQEA